MDSYKGYIQDLVVLLIEKCDSSSNSILEARDGEDRIYQLGRQMGLYEALSLVHQQAIAFDFDLNEVKLNGIVPENYLYTKE